MILHWRIRPGWDSIWSDQDWARTEKFHSPLISASQNKSKWEFEWCKPRTVAFCQWPWYKWRVKPEWRVWPGVASELNVPEHCFFAFVNNMSRHWRKVDFTWVECLVQGFLRCFRNTIRVPRIENRVPRIRENYHRVPRM